MKFNRLKAGIAIGLMSFLFTLGVNAQAPSNNQERQKPPTIDELFKQMDANEDGKLALKEVKGPLEDDFKKIDADEDGFITKEELEKAPKPKRERPSKNR